MTIRPLTNDDLIAVETMDNMSGFYVSQWLDGNEDYAWGIFDTNKLVGYCSIGDADDCCELIESHPAYDINSSLLLSDVFILPEYRKNGYGSKLINHVIARRTETEKASIFLTAMRTELLSFYKKLGFLEVDDLVMVKPNRME